MKIFDELDKIIKECLTNKPTPFDESKFKKEYDKLKLKYKEVKNELGR